MNSNRKKKKAKNSDKENKKKWVRPKDYSKKYEIRRSGEGKRVINSLRSLTATLYEICKPKSDKDRRMISYLICFVDKEFRGNSYREHVSYLETNPGSLHVCGLKAVPSKSCLHAAAKRLAGRQEFLMEVILGQAGSDAHGPLLGDASGFSINIYADCLRCLFACTLYCIRGFRSGYMVHAGRITETLCKERYHGVHDDWIHRSCGVVVQVCHTLATVRPY